MISIGEASRRLSTRSTAHALQLGFGPVEEVEIDLLQDRRSRMSSRPDVGVTRQVRIYNSKWGTQFKVGGSVRQEAL